MSHMEVKPKFQLKQNDKVLPVPSQLNEKVLSQLNEKTPLQLKNKNNINNLIVNTVGLTPSCDPIAMAKLNDQISELVQNNTLYLFIELLKKISLDYSLPIEELNQKYMDFFKMSQINLNIFPQTPSSCDPIKLTALDITQALMEVDSPTKSDNSDNDENQPIVIDQNKCYARTGGSKQCSRKKQKGQDFCGSHMHNQPNGRIDQIIETTKSQPKKRGRPPKNSPKSPIIDTPITCMDAVMEEIHGINYIIDENNGNIYKIPDNFNPEVPIDKDLLKLLGKRLNNQINWYSENDLIINKPN